MANIQKTNSEITKFVEFLHNNPEIESFNKDIFLIRVNVAGWMFVDNIDELYSRLQKETILQLVREDNYFDKYAVLVKFEDEKLGYVPRKHNKVLSSLLDGGKELYGVIYHLSTEPPVYEGEQEYKNIVFDIFMKD